MQWLTQLPLIPYGCILTACCAPLAPPELLPSKTPPQLLRQRLASWKDANEWESVLIYEGLCFWQALLSDIAKSEVPKCFFLSFIKDHWLLWDVGLWDMGLTYVILASPKSCTHPKCQSVCQASWLVAVNSAPIPDGDENKCKSVAYSKPHTHKPKPPDLDLHHKSLSRIYPHLVLFSDMYFKLCVLVSLKISCVLTGSPQAWHLFGLCFTLSWRRAHSVIFTYGIEYKVCAFHWFKWHQLSLWSAF